LPKNVGMVRLYVSLPTYYYLICVKAIAILLYSGICCSFIDVRYYGVKGAPRERQRCIKRGPPYNPKITEALLKGGAEGGI
jgi:hypothetical protein